MVTIEPEPGRELDLAAVPRRVRESGFTPAEMRLAAWGEVRRNGGETRFIIAPWERAYPLTSALQDGRARIETRVQYSEAGAALVAEEAMKEDARATAVGARKGRRGEGHE